MVEVLTGRRGLGGSSRRRRRGGSRGAEGSGVAALEVPGDAGQVVGLPEDRVELYLQGSCAHSAGERAKLQAEEPKDGQVAQLSTRR